MDTICSNNKNQETNVLIAPIRSLMAPFIQSEKLTERIGTRGVIRSLAVLSLTAVLGACGAMPVASRAPAAAVAELAPSGKLRAAINYGNPILANKDAATGEPYGVSVDLSRELARRLGVPVELVVYTSAGKVVDGVKAGEWDIAFVAIDPKRAVELDQTAPYVIIEGAYMVPQASPIKVNADVDQKGVRIVVGDGSAYDLYLSREVKNAQLVRAPTSPLVVDVMVQQSMDVVAGVRQQLEADLKRFPGLRLLDGRFMVINQAMASPKGRPVGARYLREFVEEMKASGFVAQALARHRIEGALIAPPTPQ